MRSSFAIIAAGCIAGLGLAQTPDGRGSLKFDFPKDSPVSVLSADYGQSNPSARGGAMILDLHTSLQLRNSSSRRIRGVTLIVLAQEVTPGGKGSVSVPSLDVAPGETFPVRVDLRLLRPVQGGESAAVTVGLDGVLFDDLSFFGPNKLNSRRSMTVWEMEARRDRQFFKSVLESAGLDGLQKEILTSLTRQADRPQMGGIQVVRGRSTNYEGERPIQFAFVGFPGSPIESMDGTAQIAGNEVRAPRIEVKNRGTKPVRFVEVGWMVQDAQGREFLAGTAPAELNLQPGQKTQILQDSSLKFSDRTAIKSMTGFVNSVEFGDGHFWIPTRADLRSDRSLRNVAPSPEEQRLLQIYRKKGMPGLVEELKKF